MFETNKEVIFEDPVNVSVSFSSVSVFEFRSIKKILKSENGGFFLTKTNDSFIEINPPFLFIEIGLEVGLQDE